MDKYSVNSLDRAHRELKREGDPVFIILTKSGLIYTITGLNQVVNQVAGSVHGKLVTELTIGSLKLKPGKMVSINCSAIEMMTLADED